MLGGGSGIEDELSSRIGWSALGWLRCFKLGGGDLCGSALGSAGEGGDLV